MSSISSCSTFVEHLILYYCTVLYYKTELEIADTYSQLLHGVERAVNSKHDSAALSIDYRY